jgi:hypothetical protein
MTDETPDPDPNALLEIIRRRAFAYHGASLMFREVFGRNMKDFYEGHIIGFDVIKFDDEIVKPADGESTAEALVRQWPQRGEEMMATLHQLF